jgi:hypothetical protein
LFPANDKQQPDPRALLLGAEQFRSAVHSGTLEVVLETYDNRRGRQKPNVTKVKVVFDGLRRTFHEQHDAVRITKDKSRDKGKDKAHPEDARFVLEDVDMLPSPGVTQQAPGEEAACPRAYCITGLVLSAIGTSGKSSRAVK